MKKQVIQFGVVVLILLLCVGGYFLLSQKTGDGEQEETTAGIKAFSLENYTNITGLTYTYEGETVILLKNGDTWIDGNNSENELDENTINSEMLIQLSEVYASTKIESPKDIAQYGFEKDGDGHITGETTSIVAMDENNKSYTLYIGSANPYDTTRYYMMIEGDDNVYVINNSLVDAFSRSATDLKKVEETTTVTATEKNTTKKSE